MTQGSAVDRPARSSAAWRHFRDNIEVYLTAVGVVLTLAMPVILGVSGYWEVAAITALVISVVHGAIFWTIRRRQRQIRLELIGEMRSMLNDRINNKLTVVLAGIAAPAGTPTEEAENLEQALDAAQGISQTLRELSDESLHRWRTHYPAQVFLDRHLSRDR